MADIVKGGSDLDALYRTAQALSRAGSMLPRNLRDPGEILAVIMSGQELGLGPMASLRGLYLIHGKVGMDYATMIGLLRRHGYRIEWLEKSSTAAELKLTHQDGSEHTERWDVERAKAAKLWAQKGPWTQYPEAMLTARCVSSAARAFAGDVLAGCYSMDEAREIAGNAPNVAVEAEPYDPHSYDNPALAQERDEAVDAAMAWRETAIAEIHASTQDVSDVIAQVSDEGRHVVADETRKAIHEWMAANLPEMDRVFAHPKAQQRKGPINTALRKWAEAADLEGRAVIKEAVAAARAAQGESEAAE